MSSTVSSRNIGFTQSSKPDMNPPIPFDGSSSLNYLHKKFKRFASSDSQDRVTCKRCQKPICESNAEESICSECRTENSNEKPYKPKFHRAALYESADHGPSGHSIQDIIAVRNEPKKVECNSVLKYPALVSYLCYFVLNFDQVF